jgi:hypothetical protein
MPLSTSDQIAIQRTIEHASPERWRELIDEAEQTLARVNALLGTKALSNEERRAGEHAIEVLVRIEAVEKAGGWWFRAKRRVQLVQMYLGG